jgi:hypothetical protein
MQPETSQPWLHVGSVFAFLLMIAAAPGVSAAGGAEIVGPLENVAPKRSTDHDPSARALIDTWLAGYAWPKQKRFDQDRYEILERRIAWQKIGRAIQVLRLLPLQGDGQALAVTRCPGRKTPIDIQIYYEWSPHSDSWVSIDSRGDPGLDACPEATTFWTADQLAKLVDPPPLPVPPNMDQKDVVTPKPGSPDRTALLDAVRPIYEKLFGKPIKFEVRSMRVAAGYAFMSVHPERLNGTPIEQKVWDKVIHDCEHTPASVTHEYWLKKTGKVWTIGLRNDFCADDSIAWDGDIIGAPPQLVDKPQWDERTKYPVDAIASGIAH